MGNIVPEGLHTVTRAPLVSISLSGDTATVICVLVGLTAAEGNPAAHAAELELTQV